MFRGQYDYDSHRGMYPGEQVTGRTVKAKSDTSSKASDNAEDEEVQRLHEALDSLGLKRPKGDDEIYRTHLRFSDIEAKVSDLITKWDVFNSLSRITKLKADHSNLNAWIEDLQTRIFPLWLRRVVTGPSKFGTLVPSFGEDVRQEDRPIYWYYIYKAVSAAICSETVELGALTGTQRKMNFDVLVKDLKSQDKWAHRQEIFDRILGQPLFNEDPNPEVVMQKLVESVKWIRANYPEDELFIAYIMPVYQRYIETFGEISSMGKLRSRIERYLVEESPEKPDILKFIDDWMSDANTFVDDKVPTKDRTALVSVSRARSSTWRILKAFEPFLDEKTGRYILDIPKKTLLSLFEGRCVKCGFHWSKNHRCSNMTFVKKALDKE